ncbi:hypothetical protein Lal_00016189 [Lupinus albus]|nr:hypothetical protein Lal_00016189 [Lupinus albus]
MMNTGLGARNLLQTATSPGSSLPPIPATLPQVNVPPLPTTTTPSFPTIPTIPQFILPPLPATSLPNFPSIPTIPFTFPSFPFFSPPPSTTSP